MRLINWYQWWYGIVYYRQIPRASAIIAEAWSTGQNLTAHTNAESLQRLLHTRWHVMVDRCPWKSETFVRWVRAFTKSIHSTLRKISSNYSFCKVYHRVPVACCLPLDCPRWAWYLVNCRFSLKFWSETNAGFTPETKYIVCSIHIVSICRTFTVHI